MCCRELYICVIVCWTIHFLYLALTTSIVHHLFPKFLEVMQKKLAFAKPFWEFCNQNRFLDSPGWLTGLTGQLIEKTDRLTGQYGFQSNQI
jgi:hypothetical protein